MLLVYSFLKDPDFALKYLVHIIPTQILWMSDWVVYIIKNDIIQIISMELYLKEKIVLIFKRYYICWGIICSITVFHIIIFVALSSQNLEQKPNFIIFLHQAFSSEMFFIFLNILNFLHLKTVTLKFANFNDHFCGWNIEPNDIDQNVPDHLYIKFVNILVTLSTCNIEIIIKMYLLFFSFNLGAVHELRNAILDIFRL